jgi:phage-related protein
MDELERFDVVTFFTAPVYGRDIQPAEFSQSFKSLYNPAMKSLRFVGSSLDDLRDFPAEARRQAGFELYAVQRALEPTDWKAMNVIGSGTREIRIHVLGEWRVLYVAKFGDAVFVLHAFQKKSRKTRREDIELARQRYQQIED